MPEVTQPPIAQLAECIAALEALYNDDRRLRKLISYARFMAFSVKGVLRYADVQDLLHESIARTLEGKRKWKPQAVDFDTHLRGCMRSIADEHAGEAARYSEREIPVEQRYSYKEHRLRSLIFEKVRSRLQGDDIALAVLNHLLEGHSPAEIREMLNINLGVYNAARKRISRCIQGIFSQCHPLKDDDNLFYGDPHA